MFTPLVLSIATLLSLGYFCHRVYRRLAGMKEAHPPLPWDRPVHRLSRALGEVMLQTRVIRERPLAGVLHALVMWGFFAFAWVSLEHFAQGLRGLETAQNDSGWYGVFAAFWALAVLVGILGLAYRRFIIRPPTLGKASASSALVALLIVVLMATYLLGWRSLVAGTPAWQINWWLHTASLLGMLWVIPNSKHLHLLLGPLAIFFRADTTSGIRPLRPEDDEDFGMVGFGDLSQKDILDVNSCVECGRCTDVCPAHQIGGSLNPKGIILQMQHGLLAGGAEGRVAGTAQEVAAGQAWVSEEDLFQCLSCGACEQACPVGIEHVGAKILDLRRGLVSEGRTHGDKLTEMFTTMERPPHNAWGVPGETRRTLVEGKAFPLFDGSQEWLLWLGCGCNYDPHGQDVALAMKRILEAAGVSWGVMERETCCGEPARRAGNEYLYMELSEQVIDEFGNRKVKNLVTCDPHCTRMFDVDYRQNASFQELGIRVLHHTELLAELLEQLELSSEASRVTFHDPSYLSRGRNQVEPPREILRAIGADLTEMRHNREKTFCCGAGGAQLYIADDETELPGGRINHRRFQEVQETGVETVAVACPYCPIMLRDAAQNAQRDDIRVADVAQLLAERLN